VGWAGLERYFQEHPNDQEMLSVSVETAHPAKFPEEIQALLSIEPELPPSLLGIEERKEHYETLSTEYDAFRDLLIDKFVKA